MGLRERWIYKGNYAQEVVRMINRRIVIDAQTGRYFARYMESVEFVFFSSRNQQSSAHCCNFYAICSGNFYLGLY